MYQEEDELVYQQITIVLAETLSLLREGLRPRAISRRRTVSLSTVRRQIELLQSLTDTHSLDELAAWWRRNDSRWWVSLGRRTGIHLANDPDHVPYLHQNG